MTAPNSASRNGSFVHSHLPLIAYAAIMLAVSSIPNLHTPEIPAIGLDKLAHLGEYAVLAWLAHRSFRVLGKKRTFVPGQIYVLAFCLLFALLDEWHQGFIPGRQPDPWDVAADLIGTLIALALLWRHRMRR